MSWLLVSNTQVAYNRLRKAFPGLSKLTWPSWTCTLSTPLLVLAVMALTVDPAVAAKAGGKVRMEGKDYVMQDGDVVEFRFNV